MAKNIKVHFPGPKLAMAVTIPPTNTGSSPVVPVSGTPVCAGSIPGIALNDVDVASALTVVDDYCIAEVPVVGSDGSNVAVLAGDLLYISASGVISKTTSGTKFGTAFGAAQGANTTDPTRSGQLVASGATTTIQVWVGKVAR